MFSESIRRDVPSWHPREAWICQQSRGEGRTTLAPEPAFIWAKSHKHLEGNRSYNNFAHQPTTSSGKIVVVDPAAENSILDWKELSLAVFLVEPWEASSPKKTTGSGRFLLGLLEAPLSDVRSMADEPPSSAHRKLVRKTSRSCANQYRADSPRCSKQRSPQDQPQRQERGVGPANRDLSLIHI